MNYKKALILLFFAAVFAYMLAINFYMPLWADDWVHSIVKFNFSAIIKHLHDGYCGWSGRMVTYFLGALFPLESPLDIRIFDIVNALFFVLLVYLIFLIVYEKKPQNLSDLSILLLIFSLIWFVPVTLAEVVLWKSASPLYLWSIPANLTFIYYYKRLLENKAKILDGLVNRMLFLIAGMLLSMWLENLSLTICILLVGILFYKKRRKNAIPVWAYTGTGGYILGTFISISAPGNYVRATFTHGAGYFQLSFLQKIFILGGQIGLHFLPFVILYLIIFALRYKFKLKNDRYELRWYYVFLALALLSAIIMGGAPGSLFYGRTTFVSDIFAIIATICLLPIDNKIIFKKIIWPLLILVILPLQVFDMVKTYKFYHQLHEQVARREGLIKVMAQHDKNLSVAPIYFSRRLNTFNISGDINQRRFFALDIMIDPAKGASGSAKLYYHLNSIKLVPDLIFSDNFPKVKVKINTKTPFVVTLQDNKIYYINMSKSCDNIKSKQDFMLNVYPKNWFGNKWYAINEIFYLHDKRLKIIALIKEHKSLFYFFDPKLWVNWQDLKSDFNDFSFTWDEAKRVMVLTKNFQPVNNVCMIVDYLPDYPIDHIETGQVKDGKLLWKTILRPNNP